ncbi:hypothetical protein [Limosilactobacillus ingluviei]|uniref:hypothetical protein n=1 Tax=Limosilactobacillus ingluviei TaxID=148604 RepID=UPI0002D68644|nr:hypothetical protein [Limosilactobacillus ingluviei]
MPSEDGKVKVDAPTKLTDSKKGQVEEAIKDANPNLITKPTALARPRRTFKVR